MAIEVETKDCTMLGDAEIEEMADLCAMGPNPFGIGLISKQTEEWVLITTVREGGPRAHRRDAERHRWPGLGPQDLQA